jgi:hypothetical protein
VLPKVQEVLNDVRRESQAGMDDEEYELLLNLLRKLLRNVTEQVRKGEKE